jgi:hypothetical protein
VRRVHADDGRPGAADTSARHRHLEWKPAGAADDRPILTRSEHALERKHTREPLSVLGVRFLPEVLADREDGLLELLEILDCFDVQAHARTLAARA